MELYGKNKERMKQKEMVELTIPVEGMSCSSCEFNIENAVKKPDGIIQVDADYKKGVAYIKLYKHLLVLKESEPKTEKIDHARRHLKLNSQNSLDTLKIIRTYL